MKHAPVFDQTYRHYLTIIGQLDLAARQERLGLLLEGESALIDLYERRYRLSPQGIFGPEGRAAGFDTCVILARYLLHEPPAAPPGDGFCTFKDFKDAGPLTAYFNANAQGAIARGFTGRTAELIAAGRKMGAAPLEGDWAYQVKLRFKGLPRISVYLLFNDQDEEFAAQCTLLFKCDAGHFLDMESLSILARRLAQKLINS